MVLVMRLTFTRETPGTFFTAFSTAAEQAEQVMPVTSYLCSIVSSLPHPQGGVYTHIIKEFFYCVKLEPFLFFEIIEHA